MSSEDIKNYGKHRGTPTIMKTKTIKPFVVLRIFSAVGGWAAAILNNLSAVDVVWIGTVFLRKRVSEISQT